MTSSISMRHPVGARTTLTVLVMIAFVLWTGLLDGHGGVTPLNALTDPLRLLSNALPGLLLAALVFALTRRVLFSAWLGLLFEGLVFEVNALKVAQLKSPLMPADFDMLGQMNEGGGHLLSSYLPHGIWIYLALAGVLLITVALAVWEPALFARHRGARAAAAIVATGLLVSLVLAAPAWQVVYGRARLGLEPWSAGKTAERAGLVNMLALFRLQYANAHHHADPARARRLLAAEQGPLRAQMTQHDAGPLPDIVIVQSESFFDPAQMKGYDTPLMPNLHRLEQHATSGPLHVPTFGGGTIRTEFEVLSGLSLRYFPEVHFPYLQIQSRNIPGLVRTLEKHGYDTLAIHANRPEFWNRTAAFRALGFQRFLSLGDFPADTPRDGRYVSDRAMTDEILRRLNDTGPPQFIFAISIEAHGPYDPGPGIDAAVLDSIEVPPGIEGDDKTQLQDYIYHARHADEQLGRLASALEQRARPALLLFYGDHLPALVPSYQKLGFDDGRGMLEQTVPWLLLDTRDRADEKHRVMAAWMLPGLLLQRAGIHDDAYFDLTQVIDPQLATLTRAPDAPRAEAGAMTQLDNAMSDVSWMRLHRQLASLWPATTAVAGRTATTTRAAAPPRHSPATGMEH